MTFRTVCKTSDIPVGKGRRFAIDERQIVIFHLDDGFFATQRRCTHAFAPLENGVVENGKVRCPWHRAEFDIKTGDVARWASFPPGVQLMNIFRSKKPLQTYPVKIEGEDIQVDL